MTELSVIVPVYNDREVIPYLYDRLSRVMLWLKVEYEIMLIDDGSNDGSLQDLIMISKNDNSVRIIALDRNYGQEEAIAAGLDQCRGQVIVIMDSDLQDRPEDIPLLMNKLKTSGKPMVIARRKGSPSGIFRLMFKHLFFRLCNLMTVISHDPDLGVFRILKKEILEDPDIIKKGGSSRLSRLYNLSSGYAIADLEKDKRFAGRSGYNLVKLFRLTWRRFFYNLPLIVSTSKKHPYRSGYKIRAIYQAGVEK